MWKLIDSDALLEQLKIGYLISEKTAPESSFQITQINDNGIITAVKTNVQGDMIIFPKKDLMEAKWWVYENYESALF